jgi:hypothetical protein
VSAVATPDSRSVRHRWLPRVHFDAQVRHIEQELREQWGDPARSFGRLLAARYSRGDAVRDLRADFDRWFDTLQRQDTERRAAGQRLWQPLVGPATWLPAFDAFVWGVCLGTPAQLQALLEMAGPSDALLDTLGALVVPGRPIHVPDESRRQWRRDRNHPLYAQLFLPKRFAGLWQALQADSAVAHGAALFDYLKKWYVQSGAAADRVDDEGCGAWCAEAAAVVRLLRLDDTPWRDHPHYPVDLAHADEPDWQENTMRATPTKLRRHRPAMGAPRDPQADAMHWSAVVAANEAELEQTHADRVAAARQRVADNPGSASVFDAWIVDREARRGDVAETLAEIAGTEHSRLRTLLRLLAARYSRGDPLESMRPLYLRAIVQLEKADAAHRSAAPDDPTQAMWAHGRFLSEGVREAAQLMSLAWHYADGAGLAQCVAALVRGEALTDTIATQAAVRLADHFGITQLPRTPQKAEYDSSGPWLEYPARYGPLLESLQHGDSGARAVRLALWVAEWSERGASLNDWKSANLKSHYVGFWCWEAALAVQLFDLNAAPLRDAMFVPAALIVDPRQGRTGDAS